MQGYKCAPAVSNKGPGVTQEENQWFFDILEKYNDIRYQCKLFGATYKEVEIQRSNIRIEKLKFDKFNGDLRTYPIITGENKEEIRENKFPALLKLLLRFKDRIEYQQSGLRFLNQNKYSSHHVDNEKCDRLSAAANGNQPDSHP